MTQVLIVDDALTVRMYHKKIVEELGAEAIEAENGVEAIEKLMTHNFGLCLVDVNMPKMDGMSFVREVRSPRINCTCPIIMISTESQQLDEASAYMAGANLFLVKPAQRKALQSYCRYLMDEDVA